MRQIRFISKLKKDKIINQKNRIQQSGFHWEKLKFENYLHNQSVDIAIGVDQNNKEEAQAIKA